MTIVSCCPSEGIARFACARAGCGVCMEGLLHEHRELVRVMVMRQGSGKAEYADLMQAGQIGLWRAIRTFEASRGVRFSTYACVIILREVWQAVRRSQTAEGWLEEVDTEEGLDRVVRIWQQVQIQQALAAEVEGLPEPLCKVIELHYGLSGATPCNLAQIGRAWHLSRERIRQLHNEALALLRLPALSIRLRSLCERQDRSHYRQTLRQHQNWQRKVRRRR